MESKGEAREWYNDEGEAGQHGKVYSPDLTHPHRFTPLSSHGLALGEEREQWAREKRGESLRRRGEKGRSLSSPSQRGPIKGSCLRLLVKEHLSSSRVCTSPPGTDSRWFQQSLAQELLDASPLLSVSQMPAKQNLTYGEGVRKKD